MIPIPAALECWMKLPVVSLDHEYRRLLLDRINTPTEDDELSNPLCRAPTNVVHGLPDNIYVATGPPFWAPRITLRPWSADIAGKGTLRA